VLILSTFGADSALAKWKDFSFINYSGKSVLFLYIVQSGRRDWGKDFLSSSPAVLLNGDSIACTYNNKYRYFDIRVVFSDWTEAIFRRHDFRELWRLTLFDRSGTYTIRSN
ncbi:MAG: hypothetical protein IJF90_09170, partial [Synergistaceae bacterium]|nr:hypothetical protein [Synergistaceae bacterium]